MKLRRLTLADRPLFERFLAQCPRDLSAYSFPAVYVWRELFDISWQVIEGNLCIFFRDPVGQFLYTSPLGKHISAGAVASCFAIMDKTNVNPAVSRIENIASEDQGCYEKLGYAVRHKADEYVCARASLARLSGDRFKSKRSCVNFFIKHYDARYAPLSVGDIPGCIALFKDWMRQRHGAHDDAVYRGMLSDSFRCLTVCLAEYRKIGLTARVVRVEDAIRGFTIGFPLSRDTFCVLFEVADRAFKGLSQFIFQRFCQELAGYDWINVMDDSGLANLKKVKLSYHPQKTAPAFIATRQ